MSQPMFFKSHFQLCKSSQQKEKWSIIKEARLHQSLCSFKTSWISPRSHRHYLEGFSGNPSSWKHQVCRGRKRGNWCQQQRNSEESWILAGCWINVRIGRKFVAIVGFWMLCLLGTKCHLNLAFNWCLT